jgi:hypothetical protein
VTHMHTTMDSGEGGYVEKPAQEAQRMQERGDLPVPSNFPLPLPLPFLFIPLGSGGGMATDKLCYW